MGNKIVRRSQQPQQQGAGLVIVDEGSLSKSGEGRDASVVETNHQEHQQHQHQHLAYIEKGDFALVSATDESRRCRLHYKEFGDKTSPRKLLLIMGLSAPFTLWINQALYFSSLTSSSSSGGDDGGGAFHVLVYDHRGTGFSDCTLHRYTTKMLARDAADLCDHVGWTNDKIHIVGYSLGGMIAQELIELWGPQRIASVTLCATQMGGLHRFSWFPSLECIWKFATLAMRRSNQSRIRHMLDVMFSQQYLDGEEKRQRAFEEINRLEGGMPLFSAVGVVSQLAAVMTHSVSANQLNSFREMGIPILVISGRHDKIVKPHNSLELSRHLRCEALMFDAGHMVMMEQKELFNQALLQHFVKAEQLLQRKAVSCPAIILTASSTPS